MSEPTQAPEQELLSVFFRAMRSILDGGDPTSPLGDLPLSQIRCLHMIAGCQGAKMLDVARGMEIKLPALSQIVDRLVKRGLLERQSDPNDRRIVQPVLTEPARQLLQATNAARRARVRAAMDYLEPADAAKVMEALTLLAGAVERAAALERAAYLHERGGPAGDGAGDHGCLAGDGSGAQATSK
jgi:DNA-binding MarR family transcriptional regulator